MIYAILGALIIGITLGLLGSGGSILTVPVLIYLLDEPEKAAIAESLAIVAAISLIAAIPYARQKLINWRNVFWFGIPGMAGTWGGAMLAGYVSSSFQLIVFAAVMLIAAAMMFKDGIAVKKPVTIPKVQPALIIIGEGLLVGVLTGFVGVGGGFLIVPALVILGGLSMQSAVATSLVIIFLKSVTGFYKYLDILPQFDQSVNWKLIGIISMVGAAGSLAGNKIGSALPQKKLKLGFAVFLILMGFYILWMNI
jgi:uncharacterized membrane protein YfcA